MKITHMLSVVLAERPGTVLWPLAFKAIVVRVACYPGERDIVRFDDICGRAPAPLGS